MDLIMSSYISDFLDFLSATKEATNMAQEELSETSQQINDILHYIEFTKCNAPDRMAVYKRLHEVRQARRRAKETIESSEPILSWLNNNSQVVHDLQKILGSTRKIESAKSRRRYALRTNILSDICDQTYLSNQFDRSRDDSVDRNDT